MNYWIFQSNPDRFDIDKYMKKTGKQAIWLVKQYKKEICKGDYVFIWRARGKCKLDSAGIIAKGKVTSEPKMMKSGKLGYMCWKDKSQGDKHLRVKITLEENYSNDIKLTKKLLEDSCIFPNVVFRHTNRKINSAEAVALADLIKKLY